MKIEYEILKEDYKKSGIESILKTFWKYLLLILVPPLLIAFIIARDPFEWKIFLVSFFASLLLLLIFLFRKSVVNLYKLVKLIESNPSYTGKKLIVLQNDGLVLGKETQAKYEWNSIQELKDLKSYIIVVFKNKTSITICKKSIDSEEICYFIEKVNAELSVKNAYAHVNRNIYWFGLFGLVPLVGLISGSILLYLGIKRSDKRLKFIGIGSFLVIPLFWFAFPNFRSRTTSLDRSNISLTNKFLNRVVRDLEDYKYANGKYPDNLDEIRQQKQSLNENKLLFRGFFDKRISESLYYKKTDSDYILKSYGPDKILNTKDDIYPKFKPSNK